MLTQTLDAYKLPTIADVPEIVCEFVDQPDAHLTNLGSKGLGEPPIIPTAAAIANAIRDATGAEVRSVPDHPRGDAAGTRGGGGERRRSGLELLRPSRSRRQSAALKNGAMPLGGGTDLVPRLRDGIVKADTLVSLIRCIPRGFHRVTPPSPSGYTGGLTIGAGTTLGELEASSDVPEALREACRLSASPQLRATGTIGGNLLQATRRWYWRLKFPCYLHGGDNCHAKRRRSTASTPSSATSCCASAHPSDPAAALLALGASHPYRSPRAPDSPSSTACRPTTTATSTTLEPGELIVELEVPER